MTKKHLVHLLAALSIPATAGAATVGKADWMDGMSTVIPTMFCAPTQYFRQCYSVSAVECEQTSATATRVCLDKHKAEIPAVLVQPADGTRFGQVIGRCAGLGYEAALTKKRVSNAKCNDPAAWR